MSWSVATVSSTSLRLLLASVKLMVRMGSSNMYIFTYMSEFITGTCSSATLPSPSAGDAPVRPSTTGVLTDAARSHTYVGALLRSFRWHKRRNRITRREGLFQCLVLVVAGLLFTRFLFLG